MAWMGETKPAEGSLSAEGKGLPASVDRTRLSAQRGSLVVSATRSRAALSAGITLATVAITKVKISIGRRLIGLNAKPLGMRTAPIKLMKPYAAGRPTTPANAQAMPTQASPSPQKTPALR